jgi:hypothetical protein
MGLLYLFTKQNTLGLYLHSYQKRTVMIHFGDRPVHRNRVLRKEGKGSSLQQLYIAHRKKEVPSASIITFQNSISHTFAAPTGDSQLVNQVDVCEKQDRI